jgi:hypothetical protein
MALFAFFRCLMSVLLVLYCLISTNTSIIHASGVKRVVSVEGAPQPLTCKGKRCNGGFTTQVFFNSLLSVGQKVEGVGYNQIRVCVERS